MEDLQIVKFLIQLAAGGMGGVIISFLLKSWPTFDKLAGDVKRGVILSIYIVLPVLATLLLQNVPQETWVVLEPYFKAVAAGFAAFLAGEYYYRNSLAKRGPPDEE